MASMLSARLNQVEKAQLRRDEEANERIRYATEIAVNYTVEMDMLHGWLPKLILKQRFDTDSVVVDNRWDADGSNKAQDPVYVKALTFKLGTGFKVAVRRTRLLRRPYIEAQYVPTNVGFDEYVAPLPQGAL